MIGHGSRTARPHPLSASIRRLGIAARGFTPAASIVAAAILVIAAIVTSATLVLAFEQRAADTEARSSGSADTEVRSFGDALWWSGTTMTIGQPADVASPEARVLATVLRLWGLGAVIYVGAHLAARFMTSRLETAPSARWAEATHRQLDEIERNYREEREAARALREELRALRADLQLPPNVTYLDHPSRRARPTSG